MKKQKLCRNFIFLILFLTVLLDLKSCQDLCGKTNNQTDNLQTQIDNLRKQLLEKKDKIQELESDIQRTFQVSEQYNKQNHHQRVMLAEQQERIQFYKKFKNKKIKKEEEVELETQIAEKRKKIQKQEWIDTKRSIERPQNPKGNIIEVPKLSQAQEEQKKNQREKMNKPTKRAMLSNSKFHTEAFWAVLEDDNATSYVWDIQTEQHSIERSSFVYIQDRPVIFQDFDNKQMTTKFRGAMNFHKTQLTQNLRDFDLQIKEKKQQNIFGNINSNKFYPRSFILHPNSHLLSAEEVQFLDVKSDKIWIQKDEKGSTGRGIDMVDRLDKFQANYIKHKESIREQNEEERQDNNFDNFVIQEYIDNPLKIGETQRKCDYRIMILSIYTGKNWVLYMQNMENWFVRCAVEEFSLKEVNLKTHTTHQQKLYKQKDEMDGEIYQSLINSVQFDGNIIIQEIQKYNNNNNDNINKQNIETKFQQMVAYTMLAGLDKITNKNIGTFRLWGVDSMLDSELNPWLFEINTAPDLKLSSPQRTKLSKQFAKDVVEVVMKYEENWNQMDNFAEKGVYNIDLGNLVEIYNGASQKNVFQN